MLPNFTFLLLGCWSPVVPMRRSESLGGRRR
jgi:hypothetical protein